MGPGPESGRKMSKSTGEVVTPVDNLKKYGSDAVRHWAASARPGVDAVLDEAQLKVGRRLAIKVLNASRFCLSVLSEGPVPDYSEIRAPIDLALVARLASVTDRSRHRVQRARLEARSLERTESFFWSFCDDYVELVKTSRILRRSSEVIGDLHDRESAAGPPPRPFPIKPALVAAATTRPAERPPIVGALPGGRIAHAFGQDIPSRRKGPAPEGRRSAPR